MRTKKSYDFLRSCTGIYLPCNGYKSQFSDRLPHRSMDEKRSAVSCSITINSIISTIYENMIEINEIGQFSSYYIRMLRD